jgi:hypothetical protein
MGLAAVESTKSNSIYHICQSSASRLLSKYKPWQQAYLLQFSSMKLHAPGVRPTEQYDVLDMVSDADMSI